MRGKSKQCRPSGFTLVEVLMVIVIISVLAAIVIPKVSSSSVNARKNADIATAHQVKSALDRYQAENGAYPTSNQMSATSGTVTSAVLIPNYIAKLDRTVTQQQTDESKKGFAVASLTDTGTIPSSTPTHLIMIYLDTTGTKAEVRAYDIALANVLWSSAN